MTDQVYRERRGPSAVAWIALIVAVAALIIAWMAYDRTGANLQKEIQVQVQKSVDATQKAAKDTTDAIDAGPDGVDEDDTDVNTQP